MPATIAAVPKLSSRLPAKVKPPGSRLKALPWAALVQAGMAFGERWRSLSEKDRARLSELVRGRVRVQHGRLGQLSAKERVELRKLVGKLDVKGMGRDMLPLFRGAGRRKRR
jgi:hypothetical protein